jgi:uncharacterized protein (DUF1684 family)
MIKSAFCFGMMVLFLTGIFETIYPKEHETKNESIPAIQRFREEKDRFFKHAPNSPLQEFDRLHFKGLQYFPINPMYRFQGKIERYVININDPKYYGTFQTNKGPKKRFIRYGRFRLVLGGKHYTLELYKSILGDKIFIPFYDKTNGQETYEGGRYVDAEILMPGYRIIIDFNYAYNPSCAYSNKFVCILPLEENRLNIEP